MAVKASVSPKQIERAVEFVMIVFTSIRFSILDCFVETKLMPTVVAKMPRFVGQIAKTVSMALH